MYPSIGSTVTHTYMEELANTDLASHPGYVLDSITPEGNLTIANEKENLVNNVVTINYILRTDLSYVVKHEYEGHEELNSQDAAIENQTYGDEITEITKKELPGFEYVSHTPNPLKIGVGENIITAYYRLLHNLTYTIEYYVDEELKETETSDAVYSIDDKITSSEIATLGTNGASKFEGYKYDHSNVGELLINADVTKNVIKLYYTKRNDIKYRIEYYYDNKIDETLTKELEGTYLEQISEYTEKVKEGYVFAKVENVPLTLTTDEASNVIKVYYVTDGKGTVIEIPKTGIGYTNNSYELFSLLFILAISYFLKNKKVSE